MSTIDDVVRVSGASRSTVYRYLAGKSIRKSSKEAIQNAIKTLNFHTNTLKKKREYNIQIWSRGDNGWASKKYLRIFNGSTEALNEMLDAINNIGSTARIFRGDVERSLENVDGVIIMIKTMDEELRDMEQLRTAGIPFVMFYRQYDESDVSYITCDNRQVAFEITQYFINHGHRKIAIIGDINSKLNSSHKLDGYARCLEKNGINFDENMVCKEANIEDAQEWVIETFKKKNRPTALIAMNDTYSICMSDAIKSLGLKIPEDVAVFGMDNSDATAIYNPPLSSVSIPFAEMGKSAVEILVELIENPGLKSIKKFSNHKLVIRKSSETE